MALATSKTRDRKPITNQYYETIRYAFNDYSNLGNWIFNRIF
jgi:hypothetical protein